VKALEAWIWSTGVAGSQDATATLSADEGFGPVSVTLPAPAPLRLALSTWGSLLTAAPGLAHTYAIFYDETTGLITISADGVFSLAFAGNLGNAFGFTSGPWAGAASYTGDVPTLLRVDLPGLDTDIADPAEDVDMLAFEHGRSVAVGFGNYDTISVGAWLYDPQWQAMSAGYLLSGRLRIYTSSGWPWSADAAGILGYLDADVVSWSRLDRHRADESLTHVQLRLARGRT